MSLDTPSFENAYKMMGSTIFGGYQAQPSSHAVLSRYSVLDIQSSVFSDRITEAPISLESGYDSSGILLQSKLAIESTNAFSN